MSELIQENENRAITHWNLLTSVSALALMASTILPGAALADDSSRPQLWIELGGQLTRLDDEQEVFSPDIMANRPAVLAPSQKFEHPPRFSIDGDGELLFQPKHSDWIFSAAIKYGRATSDQHAHQQTKPEPFVRYYYTSYPTAGSGHISRRPQKNVATPHAAKFADTDARTSEQHFVLDFQAGKDVGLGMFGSKDGSSVVNLGIRFAQFSSKSNIGLKSDPDWHFNYKYLPTSVLTPNNPSPKLAYGEIYHSNSASLRASRNFHGMARLYPGMHPRH